ncbi:hypothetical protein J3D54_005181 [Pseudomonas sp. GGS8]|uniref:hypothetical protein n=1 Tax=Pseudomonas sp. GGS8 TaxID=2817892 RepID=UPI00209EDE8F|nr:hypothetical protein [Pseudomonas sp. GGS8]MCP1446049.1 hypothetical protein [Pseudomonas sp. GGS8]
MESLIQLHEVSVEWRRFDNFFALWKSHRSATQLIYVIGETHRCYIGSIGSRKGELDLGARYQWQSVICARAILGLEEDHGQVAYAGILKKSSGSFQSIDIVAIEADVQNSFVLACGFENALFDPKDLAEGYSLTHSGELPSFLLRD